jgi:lipoyl-dependent peroxiredoxin
MQHFATPKGDQTMKAIYTASAHVAGGRLNGRGRTSDGALDLVLRPPVGLGGKGGGTNPEQLLAIGWAACFEATLATAAHRNKVSMSKVADAEIASRVMLVLPAAEASAADFELGVEFDITLPSITDPVQAAELVRAAHHLCPYSKATRGNIDVRLTVNGRTVD